MKGFACKIFYQVSTMKLTLVLLMSISSLDNKDKDFITFKIQQKNEIDQRIYNELSQKNYVSICTSRGIVPMYITLPI